MLLFNITNLSPCRWIKVTITNDTSTTINYLSEREFRWGTRFHNPPKCKSQDYTFCVCNMNYIPIPVSGKIKFEITVPRKENVRKAEKISLLIEFSNPLVGQTKFRCSVTPAEPTALEVEENVSGDQNGGIVVKHHRSGFSFNISYDAGGNNAIVSITGRF